MRQNLNELTQPSCQMTSDYHDRLVPEINEDGNDMSNAQNGNDLSPKTQ